MTLGRQENESALAYQKRLVYGKLVDKTLADVDYTELAEALYGQPYSSDVARRMIYGSKKTLDALADERELQVDDCDLLAELDRKKIELQKERQKFFDQRNAYNKVLRDRSRQEELNEILIGTIADAVERGAIPPLDYHPARFDIGLTDNDLIVSMNDIHYGLCIDNYWCKFDPDILRGMIRRYLDKIAAVARQHNSENCYVFECGDAISGNNHLPIQLANRENVVEQVKGVSELIAEFLAELAPMFRNVIFVSVPGNHSRIDKKDKAPLDERLDDIIEWYLKARLQNVDNVVVGGERIDPTMAVIDIRGKSFALTHGDMEGSESKLQILQTMAGRPLYAIFFGHKHHNAIDNVGGIKTVMAGSFCGMDDYCVSKRIYGKPQQMICVCTEDGILCHYDIDL